MKTSNPQTSSNMNASRIWMRAVKWVGPLLPVVWLGMGCTTAKVKPAYPALESGAPASTLKLDNTMAASMFAIQVTAPIGLVVTVDGFSPLEKDKLKSGGQLGASKQLLPKGITEIPLPAGSHTLTHTGRVLGKSPYHFNPVNMSFDTEEGKTYVIRFRNKSTLGKLRYAVEYEGWGTEQSSQWPAEVGVANPIFGH